MNGEFPLLRTGFADGSKFGTWSGGQAAAGFKVESLNGTIFWPQSEVQALLDKVVGGQDISPADYPFCAPGLKTALQHVQSEGKSAIVFGSISPWAETTLLNAGVRRVVTVDYNPPISEDPRLETMPMSALATLASQFDFAISFSSLEHDGMGRYGDPTDPNGDFHAVAEVRHVLKPGGTLLLGVPIGAGGIVFNFHRIYSKKRFDMVTAGFQCFGVVPYSTTPAFQTSENCTEAGFTGNRDQNQPWMLLRKID